MVTLKNSLMFKFFSALTVFFFMSFTASVNSYAQMEAPASQVEVESVETETTSIIPEEVKAPLPKPGNVTVNFKDVDIKTVLHYLSEVSGVDIVPSPGVEGTVTMRLRDKSWELALDIVTRNYGYVYSRDRDIIRVIPKGKLQTEEPVTEVISLNYVIQSTAEDTGPAGENIKQLMEAINSVLVEDIGEKATFLPASNAVVVTAIPSRVGAIKEMVAEVDKKTPQIMIEAKIVEVSLDKDDQLGIDWDIVISAAGAARPTTVPFMNTGILDFLPGEQRRYLTKRAAPGQDENEAFPYFNPATFVDPTAAQAAGSIFTYGTLDFSQFRAVLTMLDERTDTNIISAPRITTLNNQRAVIKVIEELYLQKEQKTSDTATTVTVEFETKPREVGVILEVVPHVNEKGEISVNLTPKVSTQPTFDSEIIQQVPLVTTVSLRYNTREADTQVMVNDGETIFIGGLITEDTLTDEDKVPILGDLLGGIPYVGNLVKYERERVEKTEIVFFVTVHLIKSGMDSIKDSDTMEEYKKNFPKMTAKELLMKGGKEGKKPVLKKAKAEVTEVEVPVAVTNEKKKTYKPFLDFRKKK